MVSESVGILLFDGENGVTWMVCEGEVFVFCSVGETKGPRAQEQEQR